MAEKKIAGQTFRVEPMLALDAIRLQARLMKVLGPAVDKLPEIFAGAMSKDMEVKAAANSKAIAALMAIFEKADPDEFAELVEAICSNAMVQAPSKEWREVSVDGDFTGRLRELLDLVVFILTENFADFFSARAANGSRTKLAKA